MSNVIAEAYGIDTKKVKEWIKKNVITVVIALVVGLTIGYTKAQADIEMDCKYAKAVRIGTSAFECRRIL
jgi:predicted negative regulator of RcsB-dependent stress response